MKKIIIFGAGLSGITMARLLAEKGYKVQIFEKKSHIGGNCYDFFDNHGTYIQQYGPHIFHTSNETVYRFIAKFTTLNDFKIRTLTRLKNNKLVPLPINYKSIDILFHPTKAKLIKNILKEKYKQSRSISIFQLINDDDKLVKKFGQWVYKNIYSNYSSKMWGTDINNINKNIINRVTINNNYNDLYFPFDTHQGVPQKGFSDMFRKMLDHKNIILSTNCNVKLSIKNNSTYIDGKLTRVHIFYSGSIDELLDYKYGILPYRSLYIKYVNFKNKSYQKNAVINYPSHPKITRITEYKKFLFQKTDFTTISKEFPGEFDLKTKFNERFYPIYSDNTQNLYNKYAKKITCVKNITLIGRLGQYKYFDMDDAIANAFLLFNNFIKK